MSAWLGLLHENAVNWIQQQCYTVSLNLRKFPIGGDEISDSEERNTANLNNEWKRFMQNLVQSIGKSCFFVRVSRAVPDLLFQKSGRSRNRTVIL